MLEGRGERGGGSCTHSYGSLGKVASCRLKVFNGQVNSALDVRRKGFGTGERLERQGKVRALEFKETALDQCWNELNVAVTCEEVCHDIGDGTGEGGDSLVICQAEEMADVAF